MDSNVESLRERAMREIDSATSLEALEQVHIAFLGKKGQLTDGLKTLGGLPSEQRKAAGQALNRIKENLLAKIESKRVQLQALAIDQRLASENVDITLPPPLSRHGHHHPISRILSEITDILMRAGFAVAEGPDIETDYYNFEALNIPADHPARDMHDTFYLGSGFLLRTHTTPVQIRVMETSQPPIKLIVPGAVYRCDADVTHSPVFHQVEGLYIREGVSFAELKGTLQWFLGEFFERGTLPMRLRPSYFPFTEPSAEVDIGCLLCNSAGCNVCKHTGWLEVLGCGMVHPNVLKAGKIDAMRYSGFAFGLGVERLAMLKYGISDIRLFYENDLRFLHQF